MPSAIRITTMLVTIVRLICPASAISASWRRPLATCFSTAPMEMSSFSAVSRCVRPSKKTNAHTSRQRGGRRAMAWSRRSRRSEVRTRTSGEGVRLIRSLRPRSVPRNEYLRRRRRITVSASLRPARAKKASGSSILRKSPLSQSRANTCCAASLASGSDWSTSYAASRTTSRQLRYRAANVLASFIDHPGRQLKGYYE